MTIQDNNDDTTPDTTGVSTPQSTDDSSSASTDSATSSSTDASTDGSTNAASASSTSTVADPPAADSTAAAPSDPPVAQPDPEYAKKVLDGLEALTKVSEAAAILADAEVLLGALEPIGGVLTIITMIVNIWDALELPERTCSYQGLCYGLMYTALDKGDPQPNPGWPGAKAAPEGDAHFAQGVAEAKKRLAEGQDGVKRRNLILLAIAKNGEKATINTLWQQAVPDDDHLLRMFTIEWPNVGPNG